MEVGRRKEVGREGREGRGRVEVGHERQGRG